MGDGLDNGWPVSYACCQPVSHVKSSYCLEHEKAFFMPPKVSEKELARSVRQYSK